MQKRTSIAIKGPGASRALDELLAIPGIEASRETPPPPKVVYRDAVVLAAVGQIVGIVGGTAGIVTAILDWRERWLKARGGERLNVVIEDAQGNRISLHSATVEQITRVVESMAAERAE